MQEQRPIRGNCGAQVEHRRLLNEDPSYVRARSEIETLARAYEIGARRAERPGITRIPVVVHVVWNTAQQNISDAQIQSQIDVLNQDFRRTNADIGQVPAVWQSVTADARVEFFLATVDPDGNPTNRITRIQTQTASFPQQGNPIKSAATGGANPWPSDRYLNVWVAPAIHDAQGQALLGYAQFPGGPTATDGVVILHSGFGTMGTAEVGDTPNAGGPNFGCPMFPSVTCNNGPNGDMFMNYMDYTDDACMFMFTIGQVARVQAALDGPRASIGSQAIDVLSITGALSVLLE